MERAGGGPEVSSAGGRSGAGLLLGAVVSVVAVAAVVWWALRQPAPTLPDERADLAAVLGALLAYGAATCLRAERWGVLTVDQGGRRVRADLYALTVVGFAANNVLPARGGDAFRVLLGAPHLGLSRRAAIGTLLAERLLDVLVLATLFVVLGVTIAGGEGLPGARTLATIAAVAAAAGAALALVVLVLWRRGVLASARLVLGPLVSATANLRGRHGAAMLGVTGLIWLLEGVVWSLCGAAVDVGFGLLDGFYVLALTSMFALIPSGPGYAGTVDAAAVIGVRAVGGSSRAAVSYLVMVRFVVFVPITIVGLVVGALRYGGPRRMREAMA
ncbi:MAG TPA: lysylphosphatidylglycerol synthase transmembrane domain-containing protein [Baekduia sp.]|nr:lysylphosphatidylglycerol synthase transmembrane domain-containing protein [Baekduia sp.]